MKRNGLLDNMLIISVIFCCAKTALSEEFARYQPAELPKLIAGYSAVISYADQFHDIWKSTNIFSKLNNEFDKLSCNIPVRIGFTKSLFIFQADISNYFSGRQEGYYSSGEIEEGTLFISTPISGQDNKVLLILSSVSPARLTIMLVDPHLNVELMYDTFNPQNTPKETICFISSVRVINSGKFEIKEEIMANCSAVKKGRIFLIDLSPSEHFKMYEK